MRSDRLSTSLWHFANAMVCAIHARSRTLETVARPHVLTHIEHKRCAFSIANCSRWISRGDQGANKASQKTAINVYCTWSTAVTRWRIYYPWKRLVNVFRPIAVRWSRTIDTRAQEELLRDTLNVVYYYSV